MDSTAQLGLKIDTTTAVASLNQLVTGLRSVGTETKTATDNLGEVSSRLSVTAEEMDHFNGALELVRKGFEGLRIGIEAFKEGFELAKFAAELDNLREHVPVERLRMMQDATDGVVAKTDLMRFSMKALTGDLHVTEDGLQVVLRAAQTLSEKGFGDTMQIADKLMDSLRKGSSRELREFGIAMKDTEDKTENAAEAMRKLVDLANTEAPVNENLKKIEQLSAAWKDFATDFKAELGEILIQIGTGVSDLLRDLGLLQTKGDKAWKYASDKAGPAPDVLGEDTLARGAQGLEGFLFGMPSLDRALAQSKTGQQSAAAYAAWEAQRQVYFTQAIGGLEEKRPDLGGMQLLVGGFPDAPDKDKKTAAGPKDDALRRWIDSFNYDVGYTGRFDLGRTSVYDKLLGDDRLNLSTGKEGYEVSNYAVLEQNGRFSPDQMFADAKGDPVTKMKNLQKDLGDQKSLLGGSFNALSSGIAAAVDAAVTGSENIGKAFLKASANVLKGIAIESTARAAFELAMGIGASILAPADAAAHFAAAAQFGIAAGVAGAGAAALGSLGGSGGGGGGSPGTPPGGGALGGSGGSSSARQDPPSINVYVGDGFVGRPDEIGKAIADALNDGARAGRSQAVFVNGATRIKAG
jgi:hypothetical protein